MNAEFQRITRRYKIPFLSGQCKEINEKERMGNTGDLFRKIRNTKITADGDWSHEIKRRLLLGRKVMTNLDSILKSRDISLPTKVH